MIEILIEKERHPIGCLSLSYTPMHEVVPRAVSTAEMIDSIINHFLIDMFLLFFAQGVCPYFNYNISKFGLSIFIAQGEC